MFDPAFRTLFFTTKAKLSMKNNHILIAKDGKDNITIPLSDILCIILESNQITITTALLSAIANHKIVMYICDESHLPNGIYTSFLGHYKSLSVMQSQIELSKQKKAIIWQKIIKSKISNQAILLKINNKNEYKQLETLSKNVNLGDSNNNESQAALIYFKALFGKKFVRRSQINSREDIHIINSALNYGYAILRGMIIRALCASGLNPAFGIAHHNQFNQFNLADDLIEPFRVFVDSKVISMIKDHTLSNNFHTTHKVALIKILEMKVLVGNQFYPLSRAIIKNIQGISNSINGNISNLNLPIFKENTLDGRKIHESIDYV